MFCFVMWYIMINIVYKSCKVRQNLLWKLDDLIIVNKFYGLVQLLMIKCLNENKFSLQKVKEVKGFRSFCGIIREKIMLCLMLDYCNFGS